MTQATNTPTAPARPGDGQHDYTLATRCRDCGAEFTTEGREPRYPVCLDCRRRVRLQLAVAAGSGAFCELADQILDAYEFALGYYNGDDARRQAKLNVQSKIDETIEKHLDRWPAGAADALLWEEDSDVR